MSYHVISHLKEVNTMVIPLEMVAFGIVHWHL